MFKCDRQICKQTENKVVSEHAKCLKAKEMQWEVGQIAPLRVDYLSESKVGAACLEVAGGRVTARL